MCKASIIPLPLGLPDGPSCWTLTTLNYFFSCDLRLTYLQFHDLSSDCHMSQYNWLVSLDHVTVASYTCTLKITPSPSIFLRVWGILKPFCHTFLDHLLISDASSTVLHMLWGLNHILCADFASFCGKPYFFWRRELHVCFPSQIFDCISPTIPSKCK